MIGARIGIFSGKGVAFEDEYQYLLDYWTLQGYTLPSATNQTYQNQFIKNLKGLEDGITGSANILPKLARATINNDTVETYGVDWVSCIANSGASAYELIKVNSPTFTANEGMNSNGSSSYWYYSQYISVGNTSGLYLYSRSNFNNGWNLGHAAGTTYGIENSSNPGNAYVNRNSGDITKFPAGTWSNGRFIVNRESSSVVKAYRNQTLGTLTAQNGTVTDRMPIFGGRNIAALGSPVNAISFSTSQQSCFIAFDGMSEAECFQLDDAFQLYMTNLGKAI